MELLRVEIPQHIRKVQFSAKQRPVYFEWNGVSIKGKRAKIHVRHLIDRSKPTDIIKIEDLKDRFYIGKFKDNKLIYVTRDSNELPNPAQLVQMKERFRLVIKDTDANGERYTAMLCNSKVVNTPKMVLIKGQSFYDGSIREHQRGIVMDAIKDCFRPYLESLPVITEYPVRIECEIHETIRNVFDKTREGLGKPWDVDNYAYPYMKAFPDLMQKLGKLRNDDRLHVTQPPTPIFVPVERHEDRKLVFIISKDDREIIKENQIYKETHNPIPYNPTGGIENTIQNQDVDSSNQF